MAAQKPTADEARAFGILLDAGIDAEFAIGRVLPDLDETIRPELARKWTKDRLVLEHRFSAQNWLRWSLTERMTHALDKHYCEIAWYVLMNDYHTAETAKKAKFDGGREALEKKLAGTAGQTDPLMKFWADAITKLKPKEAPPERVQ